MWHFWVDVGGTFTDCVAQQPAGKFVQHKTLSSGIVKGAATHVGTPTTLIDTSRCHDPADFWRGWTLRILGEAGAIVQTSRVVAFDASRGALSLSPRLDVAPLPEQRYELTAQLEAPIVAIRYLLACPLSQPLPPVRVRLGTTRGTNALLTRRGADVAWVTTRGLGDLLQIGYQDRPELFALNIRKTNPLYRHVIEVDERISARGEVLKRPDAEAVTQQLARLYQQGIRSIAVGFLNAFAYPDHEQQVDEIARQIGFDEISLSHQVAPVMKLVDRGDTAVVNAYLNPVLTDYVARLQASLGDASTLRLMTSAGGLVGVEHFEGKDSILSGPAGGVVGCAGVSEAAGYQRAIGFDMGGTSTDVARYDGQFEYDYETEKAGVRVVAPMLAIETVAAGGGSICEFDGVRLAVGPASAGADPGPACYGRGGPLTVTDVNVFLGRVPWNAFPFALDRTAVQSRLEEIRTAIVQELKQDYSASQLAEGFLKIANNNMAQAIRTVSVAKGSDPREYTLVAFGGAAPQHACAVANELRIGRILIHPDASLLSAVGIGLATIARHQQQPVYQPLAAVHGQLQNRFHQLERAVVAELTNENVASERIRLRRHLEIRYMGTDWSISVEEPDDGDYAAAFQASHQQRYGYCQRERSLEVVSAHVEGFGQADWQLPDARLVGGRQNGKQDLAAVNEEAKLWIDGQAVTGRRLLRSTLQPGDVVPGPAIITQATSTIVVDPDWTADVLSDGTLQLTAQRQNEGERIPLQYDPVTVEIFNGHFEAIATQMGVTLRNTSTSVNVKERLDFSCAIFTADGDLVVNAPHIPVHLGAMSETVRHVLRDHPDLQPGDVVITNDPFRGGSHLPDVTVVTPVFGKTAGELRFVVASRAHHAEIGGIAPGSMPPFSKCLAEEGVLIRSFKVIQQGQSHLDHLAEHLSSEPYPSRDVETNIADVLAQIAANRQGQRDLEQLERRFGWKAVSAQMRHIQEAAELKMRGALQALDDGTYHFTDYLDEGAVIQVNITIHRDEATIQFDGSADVLPTNLNANPAIVKAAVIYVLRLLIDEPIPLNQGVLSPIRLEIPPGMLNPPGHDDSRLCPAVAGGNVETSQRIVDVLLGALQLAAASQGTMNNLLFGNERFGYYETICGGGGATATDHGAHAVHTHMTNTRLTDPEVLEHKFPLRVVRFAIRWDSGGAGRLSGGDGVIRTLQFLEPLDVSLLTQRRGSFPPYGMDGGHPGKCGLNWLVRSGQQPEKLSNRVQISVDPGDELTIETPGGGGWGQPSHP